MCRNIIIALSVAGMAGLIATGCQNTRTTAVPQAYPLTTCIIAPVPLEALGGSVTIIHGNREVKFCSKACQDEFLKNPSRYLGKILPPEDDNNHWGGG